MATVIQIKRSSGTTAPSTLKLGEVAYIETKPEYYQSQKNVTLQHNQNKD